MTGGPWYYDVLAVFGAAFAFSGLLGLLIGKAIALADRQDLTGPPAVPVSAGSESLRTERAFGVLSPPQGAPGPVNQLSRPVPGPVARRDGAGAPSRRRA